MRKIATLVLLLGTELTYPQSNSFAFYAGPELNFQNRTSYDIDPIAHQVTKHPKHEVDPGANADFLLIHQWKSGFGIQTGLAFNWVQYLNNYPVDSTPLVPPVQDFTNNPYIRFYDFGYKYSGIGLVFNSTYKKRLSHKVSIVPLAGIKIVFDVVNKTSSHYYVMDTIGIADPGPYYNEYNATSYRYSSFPLRFALVAGCSINYLYTKKISFSFSPMANFTWDPDETKSLSQLSIPLNLGVIYSVD